MRIRYAILTGTSGGIGAAAARLLLEAGTRVFGISRREPAALIGKAGYRHLTYDLADTDGADAALGEMIEAIRSERLMNAGPSDAIVLINNAALVEPLGGIAGCSSEAIARGFAVNLVAPAVLTASFIRRTADLPLRRRVVNVTSGSAIYANPGMAAYSASKAGLNMLTRCTALDHPDVETCAFDPGMADTPMQETARSRPSGEFALAQYFRDAKASGQLAPAAVIAERLVRMIGSPWRSGESMHHAEFER